MNGFLTRLFNKQPERAALETPSQLELKELRKRASLFPYIHSKEMEPLLKLSFPDYQSAIRKIAAINIPTLTSREAEYIVSTRSFSWFSDICFRRIESSTVEDLLGEDVPEGSHWPRFLALCHSEAKSRGAVWGNSWEDAKTFVRRVENFWMDEFERACFEKVGDHMIGRHLKLSRD